MESERAIGSTPQGVDDAELERLAAAEDAEAKTPHVEDDDPESYVGDEIDIELPETE
jgi:hypothetical protein